MDCRQRCHGQQQEPQVRHTAIAVTEWVDAQKVEILVSPDDERRNLPFSNV